jgi:hypothetical protein
VERAVTGDPREAALEVIAAALRIEGDTLQPGDDTDFDALAEAVVALFPVVTWADHSCETTTLNATVRTVMVQRSVVLEGPVRYVETIELPLPKVCTCLDDSPAPPGMTPMTGRNPACPQHGWAA